MRYFRSSFVILAVCVAVPAFAQTLPQPMPPSQPMPPAPPLESPQQGGPEAAPNAGQPLNTRVDPLFAALKRERNPEKARGIATQIAMNMGESGSPTVNLLMGWAATAAKEKRNAAALDFLDRVTLIDPAYVEGWNRRATMHYAMGDQRKAMADIAEVLKREPRHFGALAGLAGILTEAGRDSQALNAWERYLDIYPADREAQEAVTKLSEKIAGNRT